MSMIGHLRQVTPADLKQFQAAPDSIRQFIHGKLLAGMPATLAALEQIREKLMAAKNLPLAEQEQLRAKLMRDLGASGAVVPGDDAGEDGLSLEKSWHTLHYLLTGSAVEARPPLGNAILGGEEIGPDAGYGPARFLDASEVHEVAAALAKVSREELSRRFDLKAMTAAQVYACNDSNDLALALDYFDQLVSYYQDAASRDNAMLLYID
jgi:hypothetical protein